MGIVAKHLRCGLAASLILLSWPGAANAFDKLYVIGDSLSDTGNLFGATAALGGVANALPGADHYFNGRFSNGLVYTDLLAQAIGVALTPSIAGGTNFAYGGARANYNTVEVSQGGSLPNGLFPWSINAEVQSFSSRAIYDPAGLYVVYAGANDVADVLRGVLPQAQGFSDAIGGIVNAVSAFKAAGAQTIVVPNLPGLGLTPVFANAGVAAQANALTALFNAQLRTTLNGITGVNIVQVDVFSLFNQVVSNPAGYGFGNVTSPCYSGFVSPNPAGTECANPQSYLFWDYLHPTAAGQRLLADAVLAAVPEPAAWQLALVGLALLGLALLGMRRHEASGGSARPR